MCLGSRKEIDAIYLKCLIRPFNLSFTPLYNNNFFTLKKKLVKVKFSKIYTLSNKFKFYFNHKNAFHSIEKLKFNFTLLLLQKKKKGSRFFRTPRRSGRRRKNSPTQAHTHTHLHAPRSSVVCEMACTGSFGLSRNPSYSLSHLWRAHITHGPAAARRCESARLSDDSAAALGTF